jgi:hypothetical protein
MQARSEGSGTGRCMRGVKVMEARSEGGGTRRCKRGLKAVEPGGACAA